MPIDPATLRSYRPSAEPPRARGDARPAALIALVGALLLGAGFAAGLESTAIARGFLWFAAMFQALVILALVAIGWHEDGALGVWYRLRHPLGTILADDDRAPWTWFAVAWLALVTLVLSLTLAAHDPGAIPPEWGAWDAAKAEMRDQLLE